MLLKFQMLLYDDCEKLLECRILKKDEAVCSGETLTFNAFLVDVNDAESGAGDQKPKAGVSSGENDMKFSEKRAKSCMDSSILSLMSILFIFIALCTVCYLGF